MVAWAKIVPVLRKAWPQLLGAAVAAKKFFDEHPEAPTWVRETAVDAWGRLQSALEARSPEARVRGALGVVLEIADDLEAAKSGDSEVALLVAYWRGRVTNLRQALALARTRSGGDG